MTFVQLESVIKAELSIVMDSSHDNSCMIVSLFSLMKDKYTVLQYSVDKLCHYDHSL